MFKIIAFVFIGVVLLLQITSIPVYAHETEQSGNSSVTMHIEPDDTVVLGKDQSLEFFITAPKFDIQNCNCTVRIKADASKTKTVQTVQKDDALVAPIIFTKPDHYTIEFVGLPIHGAQFDPVFASFHIHTEDKQSRISKLDYVIYGLLLLSVIGVIVALVIKKPQKNAV